MEDVALPGASDRRRLSPDRPGSVPPDGSHRRAYRWKNSLDPRDRTPELVHGERESFIGECRRLDVAVAPGFPGRDEVQPGLAAPEDPNFTKQVPVALSRQSQGAWI